MAEAAQEKASESQGRACAVCASQASPRCCSGCGKVDYCSEQCQRQDWKQHRSVCRLAAAQRGAGEGIVDQEAVVAAFDADKDSYSKAIFPELLVALRSALRIGKPNDVSRSHYLHLNFSYSAEPPKLRQRFKLQTMHIFPYQRLLDDAQTEAQKAAVRACMRDCDAVQGSEGFLGAGVLREVFDLRFKPPLKLHSSLNPIRFDPKERYSKYGDYKTFPINPRWEPTFKAALLQPVGRRENWLVAEDIMATMQGLSDEQVEELSNTPEKDEKISATFEWAARMAEEEMKAGGRA